MVNVVYRIADPNAHIIWLDNAFARMKALRDIETGFSLAI